MNIWFAKAVILAANAVMIAIRAPHGHRSGRIKIARNHKGGVESTLLIIAMVGYLVPIVWLASSVFWFAEYPLHIAPLVAGTAIYVVGLWLFYRSHADLGTNWSITLQLREKHSLITSGIYRRIRHPMYSGLWLCCVGQALVIPNWVAGPSYLVTFALLFFCRVHAEERMMLGQFGKEYEDYMARTTRIIPFVW